MSTPGQAGPLAVRRAGVLLHLSSLPGPHGIGDLGREAFRTVDWLAKAGQGAWQMLPIGPIGAGDSPYAALSAFAGEPLFVALEPLVGDGLLPRGALAGPASLGRGPTRYAAARSFKETRFLAAFATFAERGGLRSAAFRAFRRREAAWLDAWCVARSEDEGGPPDFHAFLQHQFDRQWAALRTYAAARGVLLIGDVPIFVGADSVDVRTRGELFRLRRDGSPEVLTGVPPDSFSATGQLWGHPHYRWAAHRADRFRWWTERFARAMRLFDAVRIDHFIGFCRAYEVPGGAKDARRGRWVRQPGDELLAAAQRRLGTLPLIAEDLGLVTADVHALRDRFGLPGMRIVQNAFWSDGSPDLPCLHPRRCVAYPGTHDNDTAAGWWKRLPAGPRARFRRYVGPTAESAAAALVRITLHSAADLAVVSAQDVLGLPSSAKMNVPGTPAGNWTWRLAPGMLSASAATWLRSLTVASARLPT